MTMARRAGGGIVVIGIDGVPRTLVRRLIDEGVMPCMKALMGGREPAELHSVYPTVSSAAWTSFMTGLQPPRHGIMGFVNKTQGGYGIVFPRREHIRGPLLQEIVSTAGGSVFSMGVPVTYPPMELHGVVISCFLSPGLDKAVWPPEELRTLRDLGYVIDPDPLVAHQDRARFMELVLLGLQKRIDTIKYYFRRQNWDLFLAHVMETDRLHHFFWRDYADPSAPFHSDFFRFYRELDRLFGWLGDELGDSKRLVVLSDHGFCGLDWEVNVGKWMVQQGLTELRAQTPGPPLANIEWSRTTLYSMIPGRVWVNQQGREPEGIVAPADVGAVLDGLRQEAMAWRDPHGVPVLEKVLIREEIPGFTPGLDAPDALLVPRRGMDLKDGVLRPDVFERKVLSGMHTYDDALLFFGPAPIRADRTPWIGDMAPTLLSVSGLDVPVGLDGVSLV
ncbi:alkaline phosphatase family protein [Candidatus Fermentibacteria bacterium]|nr:alkaline phosphatase family protein [Candidatus Fermentibacteria bacterium]